MATTVASTAPQVGGLAAVAAPVISVKIDVDVSAQKDRRLEDIGHTNLADLTSFLSPEAQAAGIKVFAKKEFENPGLSHKDRIAQGIINAALDRGDLYSVGPDGGKVKKVVVAASSGNTGNSIAWVARQKGFDVTIITNRKCSDEKQADIRSKGATLLISDDIYELSRVEDPSGEGPTREITPAEAAALPEEKRIDLAKCTVTEDVANKLGWHKDGQTYPYYVSCYMKMEEIMALDSKYFSVMQYDNLDNFQAHYDTLAREIYNSPEGSVRVTDFVFAGSTCGTITGVGTYLKEQDPSIKVVLADPVGSKLRHYLEGGKGKDTVVPNYEKTRVEGAGKCQTTGIFEARKKMKRKHSDGSVTEEWVVEKDAVVVKDEDTTLMMHKLRLEAGLWTGSSSGLNMAAVVQYGDRLVAAGERNRKIVTVLCDPGFKYESKFYNDEWLAKQKLPLYSESLRLFGVTSAL